MIINVGGTSGTDGNNLYYGLTDNTSSLIGVGQIDYMEIE